MAKFVIGDDGAVVASATATDAASDKVGVLSYTRSIRYKRHLIKGQLV